MEEVEDMEKIAVMNRIYVGLVVGLALIGASACRGNTEALPPRASGYVEATDVRVAAKVPGRLETVAVVEGARVKAGDTLATIATIDADLAIQRARAERAQAASQVTLLRAGARIEDVQQAQAQVAAAASDAQAAEADLIAARADEARFDQLLRNRAGSQKQRDDAFARREVADARVKAAGDRVRAAQATLARVKAGSRAEEIAAAVARVAVVDAQIAALEHDRGETTIVSPTGGIVASRLVEPGELVAAGAPLVVIVDLDRAWANAYVEEPLVPALRLEQAVTVVTDAGNRLPGRITFIASRAEFTPRNVQTSGERAKLVYRVKVSVDNREGILKPGMPVEVELSAGGK
jgi:HlyD family secretion protein